MKKILCLFLISINYCVAGVADLSIELEFNTTDGIVVEQQGEFIARITNNGPDPAGINSTLQYPISFSSGIIQSEPSLGLPLEFAPSPNNNNNICFFTTVIGDPPPGGNLSFVFIFNIPSLAVNETIECLGIYSASFQSGTREVNWEILNSFDIDPIIENNTQLVIFGIQPRSVSVNNPLLLSTLILLMLLVGRKSLRL